MTELNDVLKNATNRQKTFRKSLLKLAAESLIVELQEVVTKAHIQIEENHKNPQAVGQRSNIQDYQTAIGLYDSIEYVVIAVRDEILDELNLEYYGEISEVFSNMHSNDGTASRVFAKIEAIIQQFRSFAEQLNVPRFS